jgi:hypothetical protein
MITGIASVCFGVQDRTKRGVFALDPRGMLTAMSRQAAP